MEKQQADSKVNSERSGNVIYNKGRDSHGVFRIWIDIKEGLRLLAPD